MKKFISFILYSIPILLSSLTIEYENTWSRYTVYKPGSVIYEDKLFVNAYCSIECYDIFTDGHIELSNTIEFNSLIRMIDLDETDLMLYVHTADYLDSGSDWIYVYQIINDSLEYCFRTEVLGELYNFNDLIYPVGNYVIFGQPDLLPCYNKQTQQLEDITFPYDEIIGSFDDKLVEYSGIDSSINFYKIEDINDPILIFQYNYEMIASYSSYIRNFNDSHCLLIDKEQILVFNVTDEQNYSFESIWEYDFNEIYTLFEPILFNNDQLYIGNNAGENFVFNVSDYNSPILLHSWLEEDSEVNCYSISNNRYLYRSENDNGIWMYDLDNLPSTQYEVLGYVFPYLSTAFFDGLIYKNDTEYLYCVDPETSNEEIICELPYNVGFDYYKHGNLLIINCGSFSENYCCIIDLETNQFLNNIPLNGLFLFMHDGKIFIQNDEIISVYEINSQFDLDYLTSFTASISLLVSEFDEDHIWVSYNDGDFLFNTTNLQIDYNFSNFFSPNSQRLVKPFKYDNRLIITNMQYPYVSDIRLYNIGDLSNPILLDSKNEEINCSYFQLDDYLMESHFLEPVRIYDKFIDSFTEPIQTYDFNTAIFELTIDEERNRIASTSSYYYFKTYLYELNGNGIEFIPEKRTKLSNHPNPFNPTTTISFSIPEETKVDLSIYNIKGQKIKSLLNDQITAGEHSIVWNREDFTGKKVSSGIYFYKLNVNSKTEAVKKCLLLK